MTTPPNQKSSTKNIHYRKKDFRQHGFSETISVQEAWARLNSVFKFQELEQEYVTLISALGRVLAKQIISPVDVPSRIRSAVDGYAIRSDDSRGATNTNPQELEIIGDLRIEMDSISLLLKTKQAIRVATGSGLPPGANAVIMVEDTDIKNENILEVYRAISVNANLIPQGADIQQNQIVLPKGRVIQPPDLGLLKTVGIKQVPVIRKPRVATIAIGDELTEKYDHLQPGEIRETNRIVLGGYITQYGGEWIDLGIVPDKKEEIQKALQESLEKADIVCTTGGTSVGQKDFSVEAAGELGEVIFHGVSMSPGMPIAVTSAKGVPIVSLAGFSVSAIVEFLTFVIPILRRYLGISPEWLHPQQDAILTRPIPSRQGRQTFVRVRVYKSDENPIIYAEPIRVKGSSILSSMIRANGYIILGPEIEGVPEQEKITVSMLSPIEHMSTQGGK